MKCSNKKKLIYIYFKEKQLFKSIWAFTSLPVHFGVWMRHFNWWWYHNCHIAFKTSMCVSRINLNIVDNGPGEQPPSLLKMLLVRLLKLESACQVMYGKFHSKRNFVEFSSLTSWSLQLHPSSPPNSKEHRDNMYIMAEEVISCIRTVNFGKSSIACERGMQGFIFIP